MRMPWRACGKRSGRVTRSRPSSPSRASSSSPGRPFASRSRVGSESRSTTRRRAPPRACAVARHRGVRHRPRLRNGARARARLDVPKHPPPRPLRVSGRCSSLAALAVPVRAHRVRALVRSGARRDLALPAGAATLADRARPRPRAGRLGSSGRAVRCSTTRRPPPPASTSASRSSSRSCRSGSSPVRIAWVAAAYPALVFLIIVGTGNHYVFDCVVGADVRARRRRGLVLHGAVSGQSVAVQPGAGIAAIGYGLIAGGLVTLHLTALTSWTNVAGALELAAGLRRRLVTARVDRAARGRTVDGQPHSPRERRRRSRAAGRHASLIFARRGLPGARPLARLTPVSFEASCASGTPARTASSCAATATP